MGYFDSSPLVVDPNITLKAWMASPLAIITVCAEGKICFVNPAGLRILARDEASLVDSPLAELCHPLDRPTLQRMLDATRDGGQPDRQELRFQRPKDAQITTGFSAAPSDDGQLTVCVLRDLSGEKALRPQMLHTERMASMGQIASMVAHELNNSLAGAIGCLELLNSADAEEQRELVKTALTELHRSASIVTEIKGYARNDDEMDAQVDVRELITSLQNLIRYHQNAGASHRLELHLAADLPPVRGNANQLLQALMNLVRNAYDAVAELPAERRTVAVHVEQVRDAVVIAVVDRGPGVPEKLRTKLFEPFFSTKTAGSGTGLGLAVVQSIAASHGGRVEVHDNPAGGAVFRVTLPVDASKPLPRPSQPSSSARPLQVLRGQRLLVADDEETIRKIFGRVAARNGAHVTLAANASEAIEQLERQDDFGLIFLDVRMPKGGGPAVFEWIQSNRPQLGPRTVFVSGEFTSEMRGIVGRDYAQTLQKPFTLNELAETARSVLDGGGEDSDGDS